MTDRSDSKLERELRQTLRPVDPPVGFAERAMAALAQARERSAANAVSTGSHASKHSATRPERLTHRPWLLGRRVWIPDAATAALAAILISAGIWNQHHAQQLRAREAHDQVVEALRISSRTLNTALHATVDPGQSG
jgi:glutathione S-transferase